MSGGGGFFNTAGHKVIGVVGAVIVVNAILIPTMGHERTANLNKTGSVVIGQGTGMTLGDIPGFFQGVTQGFDWSDGGKSWTDQKDTATPKPSSKSTPKKN